MIQKLLDEYAERLYARQNMGVNGEQQNLISKSEYYDMLKAVVDCLNNNKDKTIAELKEILFLQSGLLENVKDVVLDRQLCTGLVLSYGYDNYRETVVVGSRQEVTLDENNKVIPAYEEMTLDTIFDLASVTKIFTSVSILKLVQAGLINLNDSITKYAPQFVNLSNVTVFDLLAFQKPLMTEKRVDSVSDYIEAEDILFNIKVNENFNPLANPYTDMGAMVLKYVIEAVSGMNFYDFIYETILKPLNMTDTHAVIPKKKLYRVINTNLDAKIYKDGRSIITKEAVKGVPYDAKARIMAQKEGNLSGHAGLFASNPDMIKFAKGILTGKVIDNNYVVELGQNKTGKLFEVDGKLKSVQYLGYLCYSKNPIRQESEIFHRLSGQSFASAGWLGHKLVVDPLNNLYSFLSSNKSNNRVTFVDPSIRPSVEVKDGDKIYIKVNENDLKIDASRFTWNKGRMVNPGLILAMQYQFLDEILGNKLEEEEHVVRKI